MRFADPEAIIEAFDLEPGMQVADFGAGNGVCTFAAAEHVGLRGKVYAIDIQQELLRKIKNDALSRSLDTVEVMWGDVDAPRGTGLPDESLDAVIISNTLFLAEDKPAVAREAFRVLKKHGRVLVVDWMESFGSMGPTQDMVVAQSDATALFTEAGFAVNRTIDAGAHHYGFIGKKS